MLRSDASCTLAVRSQKSTAVLILHSKEQYVPVARVLPTRFAKRSYKSRPRFVVITFDMPHNPRDPRPYLAQILFEFRARHNVARVFARGRATTRVDDVPERDNDKINL